MLKCLAALSSRVDAWGLNPEWDELEKLRHVLVNRLFFWIGVPSVTLHLSWSLFTAHWVRLWFHLGFAAVLITGVVLIRLGHPTAARLVSLLTGTFLQFGLILAGVGQPSSQLLLFFLSMLGVAFFSIKDRIWFLVAVGTPLLAFVTSLFLWNRVATGLPSAGPVNPWTQALMAVMIAGLVVWLVSFLTRELDRRQGSLNLVLASTGVGIFAVERDTGRLSWDEGAARLHGRKLQEMPQFLEGGGALWESGEHDWLRECCVTRAQGGACFMRRLAIRLHSGERRHLAYRVTMAPDGHRLRGVAWDVTEEVRREETLEKQRMQLVHASKMASVGEMAGGIAHDINNPLMIIQGCARRISRLSEGGGEEVLSLRQEVLRMAENIARTSDRIAKTVSGLKSLSRNRDSPVSHASVRVVVDEVLALCQSRFRERGVSLLPPEGVPDALLRALPLDVVQVLMSLLNNALEAIEVQEERWVRMGVREEDTFVTFEVTDSGVGIPSSLRARIFEPFFTTKREGEGAGLGLAIASVLAERNGGELFLVPDTEHTRFAFRIRKCMEGEDIGEYV